MQNYKEINGNDYVKDSRTTINETMRSIQSMNSGTEFPTTNLFEGMKCYRTDLKKTYTLTDVENNTWVEDAHAELADEATHAASATKLQTPRALNLSGAVTADAASFDGTADATINVKTLDASKLKGTAAVSTTGNAATATKLAAARTIALSGNASGSTTFDGSGNATINATVSESAHAATATKVVTTAATGASANIAEATMAGSDSARIRVSGANNAGELALETADDGNEAIVARQYTGAFKDVARTASILDANGNTSFPGTVVAPKFTGALNGNAATASKLASPRTISLTGKAEGSASFDGSSNAAINVTNVNADTASKLSTARKINITGNASGAATFDGTSDVSINVSVSQAAHADKATQDTNGRVFTDTNAYMHISALADSTDFNNVKTTGIYYCTGNTYPNRPHNSWGILTVYSIGTVKQEYRPDNAAVYYTREYNNSNWTAWNKVAASTADTCTGNAATASKLLTPRTISLTGKAAGSTSFDGSSNAAINVTSVNADTASKLSTARKINITGNATGAANFDGSGDVNINVTVNESKHAANADTAANANKLASESGSNYLFINTEEDNWSVIGQNPGAWLKSIRTDEDAPPYSIGNYSAAVAFGGGDTKGVITHAYGGPLVKFAGGNGSTAQWKFTIHGGRNNETYDLNNFPTKTGSGASGTWPINISGNADKLDGYHASDIINKISAANTGGIVAASLTANGYVKFANGLILQWGFVSNTRSSTHYDITFPITFASACYGVHSTFFKPTGGSQSSGGDQHDTVALITTKGCELEADNQSIFWTAIGV